MISVFQNRSFPMQSFLVDLHHRNPALSLTGWLHVALLLVALAALWFDERLITGINPWIKPIKFCLSVLVYVWTMAILLSWLPAADAGTVKWLSRGIALTMIVEIGCIFLQAARGTTSHYNISSAFNGVVFGLMGTMIMLNTVLNVGALGLLWLRPLSVVPAVAWGARLGLLLFIGGAALGGLMIRQAGHTVGAPDGGPGLPLLNWSTRAGDLRIAHFVGMHALQVLPLAGWALTRWTVPAPVLLTLVGGLGWLVLTAILLQRALAGRAVFLS
jgi:hypothetical protein